MFALLAAFGGGMLGALIYAFLTVTLKANQNVTGLTLTIFGTGLAALIGENLLAGGSVSVAFSEELKAAFGSIRIPVLADIPYVGPLLFSNNIFVIIGVVCAVAMGLYLNHTRRGLNLRAVGENPGAADAAGVNVTLYKYCLLYTSHRPQPAGCRHPCGAADQTRAAL